MTIDTKELRKLTQAATPGPWKVGQYLGSPLQFVIHMDVGDKGRGSDVAFTSAAFGNDETIANARLIAAANPAAISELLDRLEAAEKERDDVAQQLVQAEIGKRKLDAECDALRAKITEMEKQEPVVYQRLYRDGSGSEDITDLPNVFERQRPLDALPGAQAQPAPSVPDAAWLPVPDKPPTFDPVDLQFADGSVLCGCVPQSDGDYWWEGPSGEVFIDPRYAPVTHWRLSADPETKPCP